MSRKRPPDHGTLDVLADELAALFSGSEDIKKLRADVQKLRDDRTAQKPAPGEGATAPKPDGGQEEAQLARLRREVLGRDLVALCLSGGGIRSAAFALGILQALAGKNGKLLRHVNYLSTVSGGGYIGSFLSAWLHWSGKARAVFTGLSERPHAKPENEPAPIAHIREYSSYLTPQIGLFSGDTWAAIAAVLRNIVINWCFLVPFFCLIVFMPKLTEAFGELARIDRMQGWGPIIAILPAFFVLLAAIFSSANRYAGSDFLPGLRGQGAFLFWNLGMLVAAAAILAFLANGQLGEMGWLLSGFFPIAKQSLPDALAEEIRGFVPQAAEIYLAPSLAVAGGAIFAASPLLGWFLVRFDSSADGRRNILRALLDLVPLAIAGFLVGWTLWYAVDRYVLMDDYLRISGITVDARSILTVFGMPYLLVMMAVGQGVFVLLRNDNTYGDIDREWLARASGWYLVISLAWIVVAGLVLFAAALMDGIQLLGPDVKQWLVGAGGISGLATALLGKSSATPGKGGPRSWSAFAANLALGVSGPLFAAILAIGLSIGLDELLFQTSFEHTKIFEFTDHTDHAAYLLDWAKLLGGLLATALIWALAGLRVNPNRFSLHALYRNRLIRAFLGGPHLAAADGSTRNPNPFTGFDEQDNIAMSALTIDSGRADVDAWRPVHVINIALNLVGGNNLAWQERKAESFVVTPLVCGSDRLGYRPTAAYGGNLTLGTALAISGAAASPNMGYHSSPSVTFLLTMFNVRLGWWLGNPGPAGRRTFRRRGPLLAWRPLLSELFGLTTDQSPYVYLSDGGHFENLGLYEMIRRRCRFIIVSDAGQDQTCTFEDLGNAIRKVRIDLGVEIEFPSLKIFQQPSPPDAQWNRPWFRVGTITYPDDEGTKGMILYIKPGLRGDEPADVLAYAKAHEQFPHESTADQMFTESQFESYRKLGRHIMERLISVADDPKTVEELINNLKPLDPVMLK